MIRMSKDKQVVAPTLSKGVSACAPTNPNIGDDSR